MSIKKWRFLIILVFIILGVTYIKLQNPNSSKESDLTYEMLSGTWVNTKTKDTINFDSNYFYITESDFDKIRNDKVNHYYFKIENNIVSLFQSGGAHINPIGYEYNPQNKLLTFVDWRDKSRNEPLRDEQYQKVK